MGAYAAIRLGGLAGASTAIALSPQFSIDPRLVPFEDRWDPDARRLDYEIERRLALKGFVASAYVFYDPADRDARHVELYRDRLEVRDVRLPDCGHPVTGFLAEVGLLQRAVIEAAQGTLDRAAFQREALEMRDRAPQYYATLALRPGPPQKKLELARRAYELFADDAGYVARYAQALSLAGRDDEAMAKFDEAMAIEPDHLTVLTQVCEFLSSRRRLPAARAVADWLWRLHPGAAPIEILRAKLSRAAVRRCAAAPAPLAGSAVWLRRGLAGASAPDAFAASGAPLCPARLAGSPYSGVAADNPVLAAARGHYWRGSEIQSRYRAPWRLAGSPMAGKRLDRKRILNLGVSGDRTQHVLWRLACFDDGAIEAKAVVLIIGVNNLAGGEDIQSIVAGVGDVIGEARRVAPGAKIAAVALPPFGPDFRLRNDDRKALNASLAKMPDGIVVGDPAHWAPHGNEAGCYQPDAVHFTRVGYERLTAAAARALAAAQ